MNLPFKNGKSNEKEKINTDVTKINIKSKWDDEEKNLESKSDAIKINLENQSSALKTTLKNKSSAVKINSENKSDIKKLINILSHNDNENVIIPNIGYDKNIITYPILEQIGHDKNDIDFLDHLASPEINILKKLTHERILVCPEHPQCFALSPRNCCISCQSTDISKLQLIEHTGCGYLAESNEFKEKLTDGVSSCPSCKKKINNLKEDFRVAGNWCKCNHCKTKFDDCKFKLHCRQFDHDFDMGLADYYSVSSYEVVNKTEQLSNDELLVISEIKELLVSNEFFPEEDSKVKGKSGIEHEVNLYGTNSEGKSIVVFIEIAGTEINESKVNEIIMKVNDISPTFTVLVGTTSISQNAKALINANNILWVTGIQVRNKHQPWLETMSQIFHNTIQTQEEIKF